MNELDKNLNQLIRDVIYKENEEGFRNGFDEPLCTATEYLAEILTEKIQEAGYRKIRTTNWLTKGMTKEQIEQKKQEALSEVETAIETKIFDEIEASIAVHAFTNKSDDYAEGAFDTIEFVDSKIDELRKKYIGG